MGPISALAQNTEKDPFAAGSHAPAGFANQMNFGGFGGGNSGGGQAPPAFSGAAFSKPRK